MAALCPSHGLVVEAATLAGSECAKIPGKRAGAAYWFQTFGQHVREHDAGGIGAPRIDHLQVKREKIIYRGRIGAGFLKPQSWTSDARTDTLPVFVLNPGATDDVTLPTGRQHHDNFHAFMGGQGPEFPEQFRLLRQRVRTRLHELRVARQGISNKDMVRRRGRAILHANVILKLLTRGRACGRSYANLDDRDRRV
jgi:hypothetical protein